jgi:hypothetical protein
VASGESPQKLVEANGNHCSVSLSFSKRNCLGFGNFFSNAANCWPNFGQHVTKNKRFKEIKTLWFNQNGADPVKEVIDIFNSVSCLVCC